MQINLKKEVWLPLRKKRCRLQSSRVQTCGEFSHQSQGFPAITNLLFFLPQNERLRRQLSADVPCEPPGCLQLCKELPVCEGFSRRYAEGALHSLLELPCVSVRSSNTLTKLQDAGHLPIKKTIQLKLEDVVCFLLYSKEKRRTKVSERVAMFLPESGEVSVTTPHHLRTGLSLVPFQLPLPQHPRISPI